MKTQTSYAHIFWQFLKFGLQAWGGPIAQIGMIKAQLVDQEQIITQEKFKRVLAIYQLLPGPEAHELCVYFGWLKGKRFGGLLAGIGFMLPGFSLMLLFSWLYVRYGQSALLLAAAYGMHPAVTALIIRAIHRIGQHLITTLSSWMILVVSIVSTLLNLHFTLTLLVCGALAMLFNRKQWFWGGLLSLGCVVLAGWLFIAPATRDSTNNVVLPTTTSTATYFTTGLQSGLLTFGGAYTILPFLEHDAVNQFQWLTKNQFLDGIGLASILPAPLVIIATFVGYMGGGLVGASLMTLGVFLPAFGFTLLGHSIIERITQLKSLHQFLDGVAAGVIGLIVVTAINMSLYVIQTPFQLVILAIALLITYRSRFRFTIPLLVIAAAITGIIIQM